MAITQSLTTLSELRLQVEGHFRSGNRRAIAREIHLVRNRRRTVNLKIERHRYLGTRQRRNRNMQYPRRGFLRDSNKREPIAFEVGYGVTRPNIGEFSVERTASRA